MTKQTNKAPKAAPAPKAPANSGIKVTRKGNIVTTVKPCGTTIVNATGDVE